MHHLIVPEPMIPVDGESTGASMPWVVNRGEVLQFDDDDLTLDSVLEWN
jgi:hypothetical protein